MTQLRSSTAIAVVRYAIAELLGAQDVFGLREFSGQIAFGKSFVTPEIFVDSFDQLGLAGKGGVFFNIGQFACNTVE